jgi:hypothetical protein
MKESAPAAERSRGSDSIGHGSRRAHPDQLRAMRTALRGWLAPLHSAPGTENGLVLATNEAASNAIERACPAGLDGNGATGGDNRVDITLRTESGIVRIGDQRLRDLAGAAAQQPPNPTVADWASPRMHRLVASVVIHKGARSLPAFLHHPTGSGCPSVGIDTPPSMSSPWLRTGC